MPARNVDIYVHGLREFRRELKQMGEEFPRELRQVNKDAAEIVAAAAKIRAPRGPHQGGGRIQPLVASIKAGGTQRAGYVAIGGARSPHAPVYEFGGTIPRRGFKGVSRTEKRKGQIVSGKVHAAERFKTRRAVSVTHVRAQPYLYPAIAAKADEVVEFYREALFQLASRAFNRAA